MRLPPMSKIMLQRIALLETKQIIALPIPECNQEKQNSNSRRFALYRLPMGRVGQVRRVRHVRQWILGIGSISSYSTNDKAIPRASPYANSKLENIPRVPRVSHVPLGKGNAQRPQSAARKQSKNKLFSIGCFPFLKAHRGITTTTYITLHVLQHLK